MLHPNKSYQTKGEKKTGYPTSRNSVKNSKGNSKRKATWKHPRKPKQDIFQYTVSLALKHGFEGLIEKIVDKTIIRLLKKFQR